MIYTQIIWAAAVDSTLFHTPANALALLGMAAVVGSLCLVTMLGRGDSGSGNSGDEEEGLVEKEMNGVRAVGDEEDEDEDRELGSGSSSTS